MIEQPYPVRDPHSAIVSRADVARLVRTFYERARADDLLGPIFAEAVGNWEAHLSTITDFWTSMMLKVGAYHGRPLRPHLLLPLEARHFNRWLAIFEAVACEVLPAEAAQAFIDRARRIADSFEMAVAGQEGRLASPRHAPPR